MVKINGEIFDLSGMTISDFLLKNSYPISRVAIERNGEIVPKSEYQSIILKDGDSLEIVSFVGGG